VTCVSKSAYVIKTDTEVTEGNTSNMSMAEDNDSDSMSLGALEDFLPKFKDIDLCFSVSNSAELNRSYLKISEW
jgi:hypothetical protein